MKHILFIIPFGEKTISYVENDLRKEIKINFDKHYDYIKEKIEKIEPSYKVVRVDKNISPDIMNKMFKMIQSADIVFANLTGLNNNVMYELGIRHTMKIKKTVMYWTKIINSKIPFDIKTYVVWNEKELLDNLESILINDNDDSPVLKEIEYGKSYKSVFKDYKNHWNIFIKKYELLKENGQFNECMKHLLEYKIKFDGIESFDQKLTFITYKNNNENIKSLKESLLIIKKYSPLTSNDYETIGLYCSISRKLFEQTKMPIYRKQAFDGALYFISKFKDSYSISTYCMYYLAIYENKDIEFDYLLYEFKKTKEIFNNIYNSNDDYLGDTNKIIMSLINKTKYNENDFDYKDSSLPIYKRIQIILESIRNENN